MIQLTLNELAVSQVLSARTTRSNSSCIFIQTELKIQAHVRPSTIKSSQLGFLRMKNGALWVQNTYLPNSIGWPLCPPDMQQTACILLRTVKYWRHSSPLNILPLFASLKSGFWTNDLLFIHEKTARQLTQRWKVSSNCVNKNILTHTGHLCSNWKLLQFNTSRISCPISLHSQGQYRDETADPKTVLRNHLPVIHTRSPPSTFTPQNVKPTSRAACKNTVGTGHWPLYRK